MRQKHIGTMTRADIKAQIQALTLRNLDAGMDSETAVAEAGKEFRRMREAQANREIDAVKKFLGV